MVRDPALPPIVFNPMPPGSPFSQQDAKMLAYWNVYARLFHTPFSASTDWSFGNGQFDIAGFPTEARLQQQFQSGWGGSGLGGVNLGPISRDSIANLKAPQYYLPTLFAEDTQAIRATYRGTAVRDGLISSYSISANNSAWSNPDVWITVKP